MRARLVGIAGICAGMTFDIDGEESTSVGRSSQNRVRLDDRSVSREHCRIECREGRFVIRDLGSYRGTLVNDKTVSEHTLAGAGISTSSPLLSRACRAMTISSDTPLPR